MGFGVEEGGTVQILFSEAVGAAVNFHIWIRCRRGTKMHFNLKNGRGEISRSPAPLPRSQEVMNETYGNKGWRLGC